MTARRRTVAMWLAATAVGLLGAFVFAGTAAAAPAPMVNRSLLPGVLQLQTVPPLAGVVVKVDGNTAKSDGRGLLSVSVHNFVGLEQRIEVPTTQVAPDRRVMFDRFRGSPDSGVHGKPVELGVRTARLITVRFLDRLGDDVPATKVNSMRLRSNTGEVLDLSGPALSQPQWVAESRTQQATSGLISKQLYYVVDTAVVGGTSVVNRAQQQFIPWERREWLVQLLFFKVTFTSADLFFTTHVGHGIELTRPDGTRERLPFGKDGTAVVPDLPRGTYTVKVYGGGLSFARPVSISKDQEASLDVISWLDLALVGVTVLGIAIGLIMVGRPHLRPRRPQRWRRGQRAGRRLTATAAAGVTTAALLLAGAVMAAPAKPAHAREPTQPVPVLAHYYIWYNPTSWNRAKIDYPLLGRYSSDDVEIMRRHVQMAKAAGIGGFLVSWKHTPQLDERLARLTEAARSESFRLGIVYQGLDFSRQPLPLDTVRTDLGLFADQYANDPVFDIFGKPLVIWTGTDRFTAAEIDATVRSARQRLLVLGDAKNVEDCTANGAVLDGQAYYWSSVDPTRGASATKLAEMSRAVHRSGGIWIAPAAPGFDARLVGGTKEVPRRDGETLRQSYQAARASEPDAIGLISWNEFSENTHIEPSERYGSQDIKVLAELLNARADIPVPADSSDTEKSHPGLTALGALLLVVAGASLMPVVVAFSRRRRARAVARHLIRDVQRESEKAPL